MTQVKRGNLNNFVTVVSFRTKKKKKSRVVCYTEEERLLDINYTTQKQNIPC